MGNTGRNKQRTFEEKMLAVADRLRDEMSAARTMLGMTDAQLADRIGVDVEMVRLMEAGSGPVEILVMAMDALNFRLAGLGRGATLGAQLAGRRAKLGWSAEKVAAKAGSSATVVEGLENDAGLVGDLHRVLAAIAPDVRRQAPTRAHWGRSDLDERDSRFTPETFMTPFYDAFGPVDTDPCAHPSSPVVAVRRIILAAGGDGLIDDWSGRLAFVNPPYSRTADWISRAYAQWSAGKVATVILLVPIRVDNRFFQETMWRHADIYLLKGRLRFSNANGQITPTPYALCLMALGTTEAQRSRFAELVPGLWYCAARRLTASGERTPRSVRWMRVRRVLRAVLSPIATYRRRRVEAPCVAVRPSRA